MSIRFGHSIIPSVYEKLSAVGKNIACIEDTSIFLIPDNYDELVRRYDDFRKRRFPVSVFNTSLFLDYLESASVNCPITMTIIMLRQTERASARIHLIRLSGYFTNGMCRVLYRRRTSFLTSPPGGMPSITRPGHVSRNTSKNG